MSCTNQDFVPPPQVRLLCFICTQAIMLHMYPYIFHHTIQLEIITLGNCSGNTQDPNLEFHMHADSMYILNTTKSHMNNINQYLVRYANKEFVDLLYFQQQCVLVTTSTDHTKQYQQIIWMFVDRMAVDRKCSGHWPPTTGQRWCYSSSNFAFLFEKRSTIQFHLDAEHWSPIHEVTCMYQCCFSMAIRVLVLL